MVPFKFHKCIYYKQEFFFLNKIKLHSLTLNFLVK